MSKTLTTSIIAAIFALGLLLPATADARKPSRARKATTKRVVQKQATPSRAVKQKYKKETHLTFGDDKVTASAESGAGAMVTGDRKAKISSLLKVRTNFLPELIKSALDI